LSKAVGTLRVPLLRGSPSTRGRHVGLRLTLQYSEVHLCGPPTDAQPAANAAGSRGRQPESRTRIVYNKSLRFHPGRGSCNADAFWGRCLHIGDAGRYRWRS
jgi:hypothetical protein